MKEEYQTSTATCPRCQYPNEIGYQHSCALGTQACYIGKAPPKSVEALVMKIQIVKACSDLQDALLNQYEVSQMELEAKSKKEATRLATQIARDAVRAIEFY